MHTRTHFEEYEVEYCDACGHTAACHYNKPQDVFDRDGDYIYTAEGCMAITGDRVLKGDNPFRRCSCLCLR